MNVNNILFQVDSIVNKWLVTLTEYSTKDKILLKELYISRIDWDSIEKGNVYEATMEGLNKTLEFYNNRNGKGVFMTDKDWNDAFRQKENT